MTRPTLALAVLVIWLPCCGGSSSQKATGDDTPAGTVSAPSTSTPPSVEPKPEPTPTERAISKAGKVWAQFDQAARKEPFNTLAMLQAHRLQANQGLEFLPETEASAVRAYNDREFRKRAARLLVPGENAGAVGEDATILFPSDDPSRCQQLAKTWQKPEPAKQLASYGYKAIQCGRERWPIDAGH